MSAKYIRRGGDLVMQPPIQLLDTTMYSFLVDADYGALTKMIDEQLNAVTAGTDIYYKPLLPMVAVVCADLVQSYSTTPPDSEKGWNGEKDFGFWVPIVKGTMRDGEWKPGRIGWYMPYLFVDNVAAMVTGREVFGFFKQVAQLTCPPKPSAPGMFSIDALAIPTYSLQSQAQNMRLVTITSTESSAAPDGSSHGLKDLATSLWDKMKPLFFDHSAHSLPVSAWDVLKNMLEDLVTGDVPMTFLKQFRAADASDTACYQAIVEASSKLEKFYAGWFTHPHDIAIAPADSHPIALECGLAGPSVRSSLGFWCRIDFVLQPGKVIVQT